MAEDKTKVIVYTDWIHTFEVMSDDEAGRLIKHFFRYVNDLHPTPPDKLTAVAFEQIKQTLKRDLKKWEKVIEIKSESGKKGGIKSGEIRRKNKEKKQKKADALILKQNESKEPVSVSVSVSVSENNYSTNNYKNIFVFKDSLIDFGFNEKLVDEWLKVRKTKKATNTETAFKKFTTEVLKTNQDKNSILEMCVEKSWSGFKAEWINAAVAITNTGIKEIGEWAH